MINSILILKGFVLGLILASLYYSHLWLTVKNIKRFKNPHLILILGFFVRLIILLAVLYFLLNYSISIFYGSLISFTFVPVFLKGYQMVKHAV